jgi:hypothetical protein
VRLITRRPEAWSRTVQVREQRFTTDVLPIAPLPVWWIEYEGESCG